MIKSKKLLSVLSAAALCLNMGILIPDSAFSLSDINAAAVTYGSSKEAEYAKRVFELVNQERAKVGAEPLIFSEELSQAALVRAKELETKFDHYRPDGSAPWTVFPDFGITYYAVAENIAWGQTSADEVMEDWMTSTMGHRENILNTKYKNIGIGVYYSGGRYYWSQFFCTGTGMTEVKEINPHEDKSIADCTISLSANRYTYDGNTHIPGFTVKDGTKVLTAGVDYTVETPSDSVNAGTKVLKFNGKGEYPGSVSVSYVIDPKPVSSLTVILNQTSYLYDGTAKKPTITVKDGSKTLVQNVDYTVSYPADCTSAGTRSVIITGVGNYTGTLITYYTIEKPAEPKQISGLTITVSPTSYTYDGTAKKPTVTIKDGTKTLQNGIDYTVAYPADCINAGTKYLTITGKGDYTGSLTKSYLILAKSISNTVITVSPETFDYDGTAKKPTVKITDNSKILTSGTDYTVTYPDDCVNEGTKTLTINGKGNYSGSAKRTYVINKKTVSPKITAVAGDNAVKLSWNAVSGAEKYGIAGYVSGKWQNLAEVTGTSYVLKNLKAGTKYRVAVITKSNGVWSQDFSNAVTVSPKAASKYPVVTSEVSGNQCLLKWTAVEGARKYGIAVYQSNNWKVKVQLDAEITSYVALNMMKGNYKMVVCANVGGKWDTTNLNARAFTVSIK